MMQKFTVSRDDSIYEAFPDVVLTDTGRLICVFTECTHHSDRNLARLVYKISDDRGRTWSDKRFITEQGKRSAYYDCARLSKLKDGRIAMTCNYMLGNQDYRDMQVHLWFSSDNGESWNAPVVLPANGIVPDRLVELESGRWLVAAHYKSPETDKLAEYLWYSDDKGESWSDKITVASDPRYNLCEASMIEVEPNVVVAYMRENSSLGIDCLKAISRDGGESWEGVYNVPLPGCHRPTAGILADGRILITYRFLQGGGGWLGCWTQNAFGAIMPRETALMTERNQQTSRIFPIDFDRSSVSDIGYTGWVQFDNGEIYVVDYLVDDAPKAHIRASAFYTDEFLIETK
ncbi:MAG: exo-alpha-sialidase [Clostridiales bacterium]|nr:exo-alpha-sialidase [Clostridiales bacterium]